VPKHPDERLKQRLDTFNQHDSDGLALVSPEALARCPRVAHFWDEEKLAGRFYGEHVTGAGDVEWDAFFSTGRRPLGGRDRPKR
jgi:hypothetical protein